MNNLKLKSGNALLIVIIIIVVLALVGGTVWYLSNQQKNSSGDNNSLKNSEVSGDFLDYSGSVNKISIKYPSTWEKQENNADLTVAFLTPYENDQDAFRDNVNVMVQDLSSQPMTLEEYTKISVEQLPQLFQNYQMVDKKDVTLAGFPAGRIEYTVEENNYSIRFLQIWTIKDNKGYVITYTAQDADYSKYIDQAETMINSFSFN